MIFAGPSYKYMEDLLKLGGCHLHGKSPAWLGSKVMTPLVWEEWNDALRHHPDRRFRTYITEGIRNGFRLGFKYGAPCNPASRNMKSPSGSERVFGDRVWRGVPTGSIGPNTV